MNYMSDFDFFGSILSHGEELDMAHSRYKSLRKAIMQSDEAPGVALDDWFYTNCNLGTISDCNCNYDVMLRDLQEFHKDAALKMEDYEYLDRLELAILYAMWKSRELNNHNVNELAFFKFINDDESDNFEYGE